MAEQGLNDINAVLSSDAQVSEDLAALAKPVARELDGTPIYNPAFKERLQETVKFAKEFSVNPGVIAKLAAQGEEIDTAALAAGAAAIDAMRTLDIPEPTTANIAYHDSLADKDMDATITRGEVAELKTQINDSFSEVANLVLDLMNRFDLLDQRIVNFNARGGHKL